MHLQLVPFSFSYLFLYTCASDSPRLPLCQSVCVCVSERDGEREGERVCVFMSKGVQLYFVPHFVSICLLSLSHLSQYIIGLKMKRFAGWRSLLSCHSMRGTLKTLRSMETHSPGEIIWWRCYSQPRWSLLCAVDQASHCKNKSVVIKSHINTLNCLWHLCAGLPLMSLHSWAASWECRTRETNRSSTSKLWMSFCLDRLHVRTSPHPFPSP